MSNQNTIQNSKFQLDVPVIGILRGIDQDFFQDVMHASFATGLQAIEVTMNTAGALEIIKKQRPTVQQGKLLGMGTIRNMEEARQAIAAGAMFLVTPNFDPEVIALGKAAGIPVITGALTPTEIYRAWSAGAAMIKVFPCHSLGGPKYIRYLRGPYEDIPLVAVGGVNLSTLEDFFLAGVNAVGVGEALFGQHALAARNIKILTGNVKGFIEKCLTLSQAIYSN